MGIKRDPLGGELGSAAVQHAFQLNVVSAYDDNNDPVTLIVVKEFPDSGYLGVALETPGQIDEIIKSLKEAKLRCWPYLKETMDENSNQ